MVEAVEQGRPGFLHQRRAGILLHISSLPSSADGTCGTLGREAYHFVDFLASSGMTVWQMLPIGPTGSDGSPYQSSSVHAANPRFIDLDGLEQRGWLTPDAENESTDGLDQSWQGFKNNAGEDDRHELNSFIDDNRYWLDDYALFFALHDELNTCWWNWPSEIRNREPQAMAAARSRLSDRIEYVQYEQFAFFSQWQKLKQYANERGVLLFGDMPIFVAHDSAEVWAKPESFLLDDEGIPTVVAGVPPDYFSETGQRWGNPLYRWDHMQADGFQFWIDRMKTQLKLFDIVRIDHFRGMEAYWEIPAEEEYAIHGRWIKAPGDALFERLNEVFDDLPLVAEDLGIITSEVDGLRRRFQLPGMKILQFAFSGGADNPYLPFNHHEDSVVYTGTHDNDTTLGWYKSLDAESRKYVDEFLGRSREVMPWPLIRSALASQAQLCILPMQDVMGLDSRGRMNVPGTIDGNWTWQFKWDDVETDLADRLQQRLKIYGRC